MINRFYSHEICKMMIKAERENDKHNSWMLRRRVYCGSYIHMVQRRISRHHMHDLETDTDAVY